jgi:DNA-binding CsgD family transcriptional regulator
MFDPQRSSESGGLDDGHLTNVGRWHAHAAIWLFVGIAAFILADLISDANTGVDWGHLAVETVVMACAVAGIAALWRGLRRAQVRAAQLDLDLEAARAAAAQFKSDADDALQGLGAAIDRQFDRWSLTSAEREVALLLLKGLSHREVAAIRKTTEPTVRQQALAIYRKAGLRNRSDLSAFFLEDLLLPRSIA